eukprot:gene6562-13276_t
MGICCPSSRRGQGQSSSKSDKQLSAKMKVELTIEATQHRSTHHLLENIVHQEFDRDIHQFYDISNGAILGTGMSGSVKICTHLKTHTRYALKTLSKEHVQPSKLPQLREEIRIMAQLDHPNILRIHECYETLDNIYLVLELCTGNDLLSCLNKQRNIHYSERKTCELVAMMLSALRYCHEQGIVHRDIKLENFLFENPSPNAQLKLIDFGFSQHFRPKEILHRDVGSPFYVAPEVLDKCYDEKCDVWSVGVVTYILLSGKPPFNGNSNSEILHAVKFSQITFQLPIFEHISKEAKDFISKCLHRIVSKRLSAIEAHQHPWFAMLHINNNNNSTTTNGNNTNPLPTQISKEVLESLKEFTTRSMLSKICLEVTAHVLSNNEIENLRIEFAKFDIENTGQIKFLHMKEILLKTSRFSLDEIKKIWDDLDIDHNGILNYHEFIAATINQKYITETNMKLAFDKLSRHHDYICIDDIVDLL